MLKKYSLDKQSIHFEHLCWGSVLDTLNFKLKSYSELFKMCHIEYIIYIPVIMLSRALREGVHELYTDITVKYDKWFEKRLELHIKGKH